jgi:hypothetical protein
MKAKTPKKSLGKTDRGFLKCAEFKTVWHGNIRVQESSAAFKGACVWVFADLSYSNEPEKNAPHLHLQYADALALRDALDLFIKSAKAGKTVEPAGPLPLGSRQ